MSWQIRSPPTKTGHKQIRGLPRNIFLACFLIITAWGNLKCTLKCVRLCRTWYTVPSQHSSEKYWRNCQNHQNVQLINFFLRLKRRMLTRTRDFLQQDLFILPQVWKRITCRWKQKEQPKQNFFGFAKQEIKIFEQKLCYGKYYHFERVKILVTTVFKYGLVDWLRHVKKTTEQLKVPHKYNHSIIAFRLSVHVLLERPFVRLKVKDRDRISSLIKVCWKNICNY